MFHKEGGNAISEYADSAVGAVYAPVGPLQWLLAARQP
jgi:hypothetical protein